MDEETLIPALGHIWVHVYSKRLWLMFPTSKQNSKGTVMAQSFVFLHFSLDESFKINQQKNQIDK